VRRDLFVLFVVPPEKLTTFKDVTIMTYMFHESETQGATLVSG
jgi:hypothetical protein